MCCGCVRRRPSLEPQESRKGLLYYHKDYLPYETFPGTSSASGAYWTNVQKQTRLVTTIVVVCS